MKHICKALLLLFISGRLFAQDTTVVKQQANIMATAAVNNNFKVLVDHMYPRLIQLMGGREKMLSQATASITQMKTQGITFESASVGSPGKFYKAGKEIHCLVPETIIIKMPNGRLKVESNLLAISGDGGKTWSFLDLNKGTIDSIDKLFPYFNHELKIPEPGRPVML